MRHKFCYLSLQPSAAYHCYRKIYFCWLRRYNSVLDTATFLKQRRKNNLHFCAFAICDFKFKQASMLCRTAKFTSKNLLKFYLFDKIRI